MRGAIVAVCASLLTLVARAGEPYRFGPLAPHLSQEDLEAISAQAGLADKVPLAVFGWYSQVLPEVRYVDVFMPSSSASSKVRRGVIIHLQCSPVHQDTCDSWTRKTEVGAYAQVVDANADRTGARPVSERPFEVRGSLTDEELISLVARVRAEPTPPAEGETNWVGMVSKYPILQISTEADRGVTVMLSPDGGVGETARLHRLPDGSWKIDRVVHWVS